LSSQSAFSKKIPVAQNAQRGFFSSFGYNAQPYFSLLDEKQSIGGITLNENRVIRSERHQMPAFPDRREKGPRIEFGLTFCALGSLDQMGTGNTFMPVSIIAHMTIML
jgi:hypothetical protein